MSNENRMTLSRRKFLTRGAMAASTMALPFIIPASALGRGGTVAPSERILMGGIGLGGLARCHYPEQTHQNRHSQPSNRCVPRHN